MAITYVHDANTTQKLNEWLEGRKYFTYDLETGPRPQWIGTPFEEDAPLDPYLGTVVLILVGDLNDQFVVDYRAGLDLSQLKGAVEDPDVVKIGLNLRFDTKFSTVIMGWQLRRLLDVEIAEQIIRAGLFSADDKISPGQIRRMTGMAALVRFYFDQEIDKDKALRTGFWKTPVGGFSERQMDYFRGDIQWPEKIARAQKPLIRERGLGPTLELEYRLIPVLADMELEGMMLDQDAWLDLYQAATADVAECEALLDHAFGLRAMQQDDLFGNHQILRKVSYKSPTQLAKLLASRGYEDFLTEDGRPDTETKKVVIAKMMGEMPAAIADPLIRFKKAIKRQSSYGLNFLDALHPVTGRVHPDFTQATLVTGRISCSPGLQTIPKLVVHDPSHPYANDEGDIFPYRNAFVAGSGWSFSIADASQIEARIITDMTEDPAAIAIFQSGAKPDIYKADGELFYNTVIDKKTPEGKALRNNAKAAWLGLGYGQGKKKFRMFMMLNTGRVVSQADSDYLYDRFFEVHAVMKERMDTWSHAVDPEASDRYFEDQLSFERIHTDRAFPNLMKSMLHKTSGDQDQAEERVRRLLRKRDQVRYANCYGGRKRFFPVDYLGWYNAGRNAPVQGGAAHIQKESMVELWELIQRRGYRAKLVNAIHDEIIVRVHDDDRADFYEDHIRVMTEVGQKYLNHIPMYVEGGTSPVWMKF